MQKNRKPLFRLVGDMGAGDFSKQDVPTFEAFKHFCFFTRPGLRYNMHEALVAPSIAVCADAVAAAVA